MEVKAMKPTAEVEYQIKAENPDGSEAPPQRLWLKVRFIGADSNVDLVKPYVRKRPADAPPETKEEISRRVSLAEFNRATISMAIEEWDLTIDGAPLEVNEENKAIYIPHIASAEIVDGGIVGFHLAEFVREPRNFLKN